MNKETRKLKKCVTISIVSHGQARMLENLLVDLASLPKQNFEIILTLNCPEKEPDYGDLPFPVTVIRNIRQKGFGENHNSAFEKSNTEWFAVVNPDIRLHSFDFENFLKPLEDKSVMAIAPLVLSVKGEIEDSARFFPTTFRLIKRILLKRRDNDYEFQSEPCPVDWVAGMFILFRRDIFFKLGGFDQNRFYMYFEDADICRRVSKIGGKVLINPHERVVHLAQRDSHRNLRHLRWHVMSAFRYLSGL